MASLLSDKENDIFSSEISFVEICHVKLLYQTMGGEVYHTDTDALSTPICLQPVVVSFIWPFSNLSEHVW